VGLMPRRSTSSTLLGFVGLAGEDAIEQIGGGLRCYCCMAEDLRGFKTAIGFAQELCAFQ